MPVTYTNEQQSAIYARTPAAFVSYQPQVETNAFPAGTPAAFVSNQTKSGILVSAAAGSGKTAVLTERIIEYIASGEADIDQLLVVTFTEAAAAEMRERIAAKISERQAAEPGNVHLARQSALLPGADISTIHAFCRKLLKQHFQQAGLDPSFKVGDDTELSLIKANVMDALFEEEYEREDNAAFLDLVDAFGGRTLDIQLDELIRDLHSFIRNEPYPAQAAKDFIKAYDINLPSGDSADAVGYLDPLSWTSIARDELNMGLQAAQSVIQTAKELCLLPEGPERYLAALQADEAIIARLLSAMNEPFEKLYPLFKSVTWDRLPAQKITDGIDPELKERVMDMRNKQIKGHIQKLTADIFFTHPNKMLSDLYALKYRVHALIQLTLRYDEKYSEEKQSRNILDFNDLEHYAINLLTSDDGNALSFPYKEVLIDEYQDSNAVQELILSTVAGKNSRFMVGDVKQSIYRFRRANPYLFIEKMQPTSGISRIDLTQNFRSRAEVLDTVNFFFKRLMSPEVGEVEYDATAMLYHGASYPNTGCFTTAIEIANRSEDDELSSLEQEVRVIARCIHERVGKQMIWDSALQQSRPARLGDMVILTRGVSSIAGEITEALKNCGVDAVADLQTGFFDTPEIKTALAFLRVVDNPRQDIELITVLHSPVYACTPDELYILRETISDGDFFDTLIACVSEEKAVTIPDTLIEKSACFLHDLKKWRKLAAYMPISRLLGIIYDDTRYPAYAGSMPGGVIRQANLRLLLERAIQYEETSFTGLFHFVRFIEELQTSGGAGSVSAAQSIGLMENRVRIMTIHKSKGLEFPIVFVSLLGKNFNRQDERRSVVLHPKHGLGLPYVDTKNRTKSNTLARYSLAQLVRRENLSEELRVLYVAMTRAKEQLILTGCTKNFEEKRLYWASIAADGVLLPLYYRRSCNTYLDWLMPCVLTPSMNEAAPFTLRITQSREIALPPLEIPESESKTVKPFTIPTYPHPVMIPSKLSISEIKRLFASDVTPDSTPAVFEKDPANTPAAFISDQSQVETNAFPAGTFTLPAFMSEAGNLDARRIGTALHTVAEHMDVQKHRTLSSINDLIDGLIKQNLLLPEEASAIDRQKIETFMQSNLAERMRAAKKLYREVPFVMEISEGEYEKVLVHGIIDCYFEEEQELVLVDYKNDAVYGDVNQWANRHRIQLNIYKKAVEESTALKVKEVLLYSFGLNRAVRVE